MSFNCKNINLKLGSKGADVKELQTILQEKKMYNGKIDGEFGKLTEQAVKKLQKKQGNTEDGHFGPKTCNSLHNTKMEKPASNNSTYIDKTFKISDIIQSATIYRDYIKNNQRYPDTLHFADKNGTLYKIPLQAYMRIFEKVSMYYIKNKKLPNYVIADGLSNNPLVIDYQDTNYNCGPASLSMCFQMLAVWVSEQTIAYEIGTTKNGSDYAMLRKGARKHGFELIEIKRNIENVRKSLNTGCPVLMHIDTSVAGGKNCLGYQKQYGHYVMCYRVENDKYLIADPTKGFKKCTSTSIDKAMKGRVISYFKVVPV